LAHRRGTIGGIADHLQVRLGRQQRAEPLPHHGLVIGDEDAHHEDKPTVARAGRLACTTQVPSPAGPASSLPPTEAARADIPGMPCPPLPEVSPAARWSPRALVMRTCTCSAYSTATRTP